MTAVNYTDGIVADEATKARTKQFFALMAAGNASDAELAILASKGIDIEKRNGDNLTALMLAVRSGYRDTVRALLATKVDIEARNNNGTTALIYAALHGHTDIMRALLSAGANIEARDNTGTTALVGAAWNGHTDMVRALLAAGANIEARRNHGDTALIMAASHGFTDTVRALLAAGANIEARDNTGNTALKCAVLEKHEDTFQALLARGANTGVLNNYGGGIIFSDEAITHNLNQYEKFIKTREPPKDAKHVYQLLAVTSLADRNAPVDYAGNVRKIFIHAEWKDQAHAVGILEEMQRDGTINAETAESILAAIFPPKHIYSLLARPQPDAAGIIR